ncbi:MAG: OmpA family protein [Bdellovibrionales bacterium]|nr:OmpA family protein [Bdellovibrionales bacterium]
MNFYLRHLTGRRAGEIAQYEYGNIRIGRDEYNDLQLDPEEDAQVSGRHAMIFERAGQFVIEDLKSLNGTYVNGERITESTVLKDGDEIELAPGGPRMLFSTKAPRSTLEVEGAVAKEGKKIVKSPTLMISDAYIKARKNGEGRIGNVTSTFIRQLAHEASVHASRRLKVGMSLIVLLFIGISAFLLSRNLLQQQQIAALIQETSEIQEARRHLQTEREALGKESAELREQVARQGAELRRLESLVADLSQGGVESTVTEDGSVSVNLPSVLFGYDDVDLTATGQEKVEHIASVLASLAGAEKIIIEGHASREPGGSEEHNTRLSRARAETVAAALVAAGVSEENIAIEAYGSSRPIADNDTDEGRRRNRRVSVLISGANEPDAPAATVERSESKEEEEAKGPRLI